MDKQHLVLLTVCKDGLPNLFYTPFWVKCFLALVHWRVVIREGGRWVCASSNGWRAVGVAVILLWPAEAYRLCQPHCYESFSNAATTDGWFERGPPRSSSHQMSPLERPRTNTSPFSRDAPIHQLHKIKRPARCFHIVFLPWVLLKSVWFGNYIFNLCFWKHFQIATKMGYRLNLRDVIQTLVLCILDKYFSFPWSMFSTLFCNGIVVFFSSTLYAVHKPKHLSSCYWIIVTWWYYLKDIYFMLFCIILIYFDNLFN